jgi:hypothetical protein
MKGILAIKGLPQRYVYQVRRGGWGLGGGWGGGGGNGVKLWEFTLVMVCEPGKAGRVIGSGEGIHWAQHGTVGLVA